MSDIISLSVPSIKGKEWEYIKECLDTEWVSSAGKYVDLFEDKISKYTGSKYAVACVNGTSSLQVSLRLAGVEAGDEVIVPPLTMSSTALSVLHNQSIPVFADVDRDSFNLDPESVRKSITSRTKAIIVVALYGLSPDYDEIMRVCQDHQLFLIEDNAECFLGYYKGQLVGSFGDFSSFSFQASKHMTCGEGGLLSTNDEELANKARRFSSLGYAAVSSKKGKISKQDIQNPDYELRYKIIKAKTEELKLLYSNQTNISEEIQKFISAEIRTSIRELVGALNRIISFSRIYNKIPSLTETKVILKDLLNLSENKVTIDLIQIIVCKFFKISKNEMLSSRRSRYLVRPRQTAIYLAKLLTSKSLPEIGRAFSNRDHTTVIHSVKTIEKLRKEDNELNFNIDSLKNKILYSKENEI